MDEMFGDPFFAVEKHIEEVKNDRVEETI